jgi:hypothetical protein
MEIPFSEVWKLINLGLVVDWQKRVVTIRLGPVTIKNVPFPILKSLSSQPAVIEPILSDLFVTARVMWEAEEAPVGVQKKLAELDKLAEELAARFQASPKQEDQVLGSALRGWSNSCEVGAKHIADAIKYENAPEDSGMDTSAFDDMKSALQKVRQDVYPTVEFLIDLLPEDNRVRSQAVEKLELGRKNYERIYMVSSADIPKATVEIQE